MAALNIGFLKPACMLITTSSHYIISSTLVLGPVSVSLVESLSSFSGIRLWGLREVISTVSFFWNVLSRGLTILDLDMSVPPPFSCRG